MDKTSYSEVVVFKDDQYQIQRTYRDSRTKGKEYEYFPVSQWNLTKHISGPIAIVKRETENLESLDEPTNVAFYEIALSFDVQETNPLSKPIFLVSGQIKKVLNEALRHYEFYEQVYIRNLDTTETFVAQTETEEIFPYSVVTITKGKAKRISFERAKEILDSGHCFGIFADKNLEKRLC
jgi:hypothetical protein